MIEVLVVVAFILLGILRELIMGRRERRRRTRERQRQAIDLARDGWDVVPLSTIGPDGPVLRDTEWNRVRRAYESVDMAEPR